MLPGMDKDLRMILPDLPGHSSALDELGPSADNGDDLHDDYLLCVNKGHGNSCFFWSIISAQRTTDFCKSERLNCVPQAPVALLPVAFPEYH